MVRHVALVVSLIVVGCAAPPPPAPPPELPIGAHDFENAARELSTKVAAQGARGWPEHVAMDAGGRPIVSLGSIENRTRRSFDEAELRQALEHALTTEGGVTLQAGAGLVVDCKVTEL